jgi:hypothetical protein
MIKKFEKFEYEGDVFSDHIQMTKKMSDYLMNTLKKCPSDMWSVTFTKSTTGAYNIKNHHNGYLDTKYPNGLFLDYEMKIKIGDTEIRGVSIGIVAWLCQDNMIKYVVLRPNSNHDHFFPPGPTTDPDEDDILYYVTIEKFIESIKSGLTLEKTIFV